jgi:hypothetical protein
MLTLVFSAVLIFAIYTLAVLSFFPRESYEQLKYKIQNSQQGRNIYRSFFSRIYLIASLVGMLLTATVIYFFIS